MTRSRALLAYDGDCAYCRGFARLLGRLDRRRRIEARPLADPDVDALLAAQFGAQTGFAMFLVEAERVHWGANAAERVPALLAWPRWISRLAFRVYPMLVRIVSRLTRRERTVCGPGCAIDGPAAERDHGTVKLADEAREVFNSLMGDHAATTDVPQPPA